VQVHEAWESARIALQRNDSGGGRLLELRLLALLGRGGSSRGVCIVLGPLLRLLG
jgi:hypothetical protein